MIFFKKRWAFAILFTTICTQLWASGNGVYNVGVGKTYPTIQGALDQLFLDQGSASFTQSQTILVWGGTYVAQSVMPNASLQPTTLNRLLIQAAPGTFPAINGGPGTVDLAVGFNVSIPNVTISGFNISGYLQYGIHFSNAQGGIATNNVVTSSARGIIFSNCNDPLIVQNVVHDNQYVDVEIAYGTGGVVARNYIYSTRPIIGSADGISIFGTNGLVYDNLVVGENGGIVFLNPDGTVFYNPSGGRALNNTIVSCGTGITFHQGAIGGLCENNIIAGSLFQSIFISKDSNSGFTSNFNDFFNSSIVLTLGTDTVATISYSSLSAWQSVQNQDINSIVADPLFSNPLGSTDVSYKLSTGSPCIASGQDLSGTFGNDYFGNIRSLPWDIGFHAYAGVPPTPTPTFTASSTFSPSATNSPTATFSPTITISWTQTTSPTTTVSSTISTTPSMTSVVSPTTTIESPTFTYTPSITSTVDASPSPTQVPPTISMTLTPTDAYTPNTTSTVDASPSPTQFPPTISMTPTPTFSIGLPTVSSEIDPPKIEAVVAHPNPIQGGQLIFSALLDRQADSLQLRIYTPSFIAALDWTFVGVFKKGWNSIRMQLPNEMRGTYFVRIGALNGGQKGVAKSATIVVIR